MEFKFRAVDDRPSSSSERTIPGQSVVPTWPLSMPNPDSITIHDPILNPTNARDAIQRQMEKDRIREEILAADFARRRFLEAEVRRELMLEREIAMRRAAGEGLGFQGPFGPMPFHPILPQAHFFDHRFAFTSPLPMEPVPLIALAKPSPNLFALKQKTPPTKGANELPPSSLKKMPKEEWSCALCQVTVTNEKVFDNHLNGKKHKARENKLRDENMGKSSCNAPLSKKAAKLFDSKELETNGAASSELGAKEERHLLDHNEAGDGLDKKMHDTDTSKEKTSEEKKEEVPVQKDQCGDDLKNNVEVKTVLLWQRKEEATKILKIELLCEICKVGCPNPKELENHKRGKKHVARLKELTKNKVGTADVTKEANVKSPTTNSVQEAVNSRLQEDSEKNDAYDNVTKEANATIPTTIAVASSSVATEKAENARLQESINVRIPTAVAVTSWGASENGRLLEEFVKNNNVPVPTTKGTKQANANNPTTTSVVVASSWATEAAEIFRKWEAFRMLEAYEK